MAAWRTFAQAAAMAIAVGVVAYASLWVPQDVGRAAPIWIANALPLAAVLRSRPKRWGIWVAAGFLGNAVADLAIGHTLATASALAGANAVEVMICGLGLRRLLPGGFDPGRMAHLALGAVLALAAAFASAVLASAWLGLLDGPGAWVQLLIWTLADTLGLIVPTPSLLILADWRRYRAETPVTPLGLLILAGVLATVAAVFAQDSYPLLFLVPAAAVVAAIHLEMIGAAVVVLMTAALAMVFTFLDSGPIAMMTSGWTETLLLLQGFVAVCCVLTLQVAAMQEQRRVAARRLTGALVEAEQAARVKAEFLANMSHEIRTPLTSILGFASLLASRDLDEEAERYAGRVLAASRNLLALVNDVLDFSRLEAGGLEIKPVVGSPEECGRDAVELFAPQAVGKGLALTFEAEDLPAHVTVDFDRVRQVLMNLVGNAVKFTAEGRVGVSAHYDPGSGRLSYRVRDTGPGLDEAAQAKLFQRFSQVEASVSRAHEGSGLGLAISRGLVEAMGGRVGLDSRPGEGSTFWFEIPAPAAQREDRREGAALDLAALAGLKLLVVDDNAANRELVRSMLAPLNVNLTLADGGQAAIDLAHIQPFELILMDLRMPGVDGWSAAREIREGDGCNRRTAILAFSADIGVDDAQALAVFEDVVRKPIEMMGLLAAILRWAGRTADEDPLRLAPLADEHPNGQHYQADDEQESRDGARGVDQEAQDGEADHGGEEDDDPFTHGVDNGRKAPPFQL